MLLCNLPHNKLYLYAVLKDKKIDLASSVYIIYVCILYKRNLWIKFNKWYNFVICEQFVQNCTRAKFDYLANII